MIIEKQKQSEVLSEGDVSQESIEMSLDLDSADFLMQMLSKNIYSDAIGSCVRETTSNALDSHRFAKVDVPIIVTFKPNKDGNYEFTVEDFGRGLDAEDVKNIISKYGASTKRSTAEALGMFGLGFKSPLAYSSSFYFVTRKDGIERKYMMYEGEDRNTIDLLHEQPTKKDNGVKVIVPVKYADRNEFIKKIKEQLAYFENVYFDVPGTTNYPYQEGIVNGFKIHRGDDFQISEIVSDVCTHICLDNVYYPMDFAKLGIPRLDIRVGLKFGLSDGIFPTPNRETIRYTQEAKAIILAKLAKVADYFQEKYNATVKDTDDIHQIFEYYGNTYRNVIVAEKEYEVSALLKYTTVPAVQPNLKGVNLLNLKSLSRNKGDILNEYKIKYELRSHKLREEKGNWNLTYSDATNYKVYTFSDRIGGNKRDYIKEICTENYAKFVKKTIDFTLFPKKTTGFVSSDSSNYHTILDLHLYPKSTWRERIKEFQYIQSLFTSKFVDLDKIVIPQSWFDARKKKIVAKGGSIGRVDANGKRIIKLKGEIVGKIAVDLEKYTGNNCKFVPITYKLEEIPQMKTLIVYEGHDNSGKLDSLYELSKKQSIKFVTFSDREIKFISTGEIHNLISYTKFMEGKNAPFKRLVTAYLIDSLINENKNTFLQKDNLAKISKELGQKLLVLNEYRDKQYYRNGSGNETVYQAMVAVAKAHNLFDENIYPLYKEIKATLEKLKFLEPVLTAITNGYSRSYSYSSAIDPKMMSVLIDLFRYYKHKMNLEHYALKLNDKILPEQAETDDEEEDAQELTSEVIDELVNQ